MIREDYIRILELHLAEGRIAFYTIGRLRDNTRVEIGVPDEHAGTLNFLAEGADMSGAIHQALGEVLDHLRETGAL